MLERMSAHVYRPRQARRRGGRRDNACSTRAASSRCSIGGSKPAASRGSPRINGTAMGGGFELCARLPPPHRLRQSEDAARPARDQGRPVSRRRRHAAHRAHAAAGRRAAISAQGRPAQARPRQGNEADRRRRAGRRSHQGGEGLDQGRRQGRRRRGTSKVSGCRAGRSIPRPA